MIDTVTTCDIISVDIFLDSLGGISQLRIVTFAPCWFLLCQLSPFTFVDHLLDQTPPGPDFPSCRGGGEGGTLVFSHCVTFWGEEVSF